MKKNKTKKAPRPAKLDKLQEQLESALIAVRARRKGGAKAQRATIKAKLDERIKKTETRFEKKMAKMTADRDRCRTMYRDVQKQLRALRKSTKQLLRLVFPQSRAAGSNVRNVLGVQSSNPPTDAPSTK